MKATGIVRRIDDLGRVVIPKEIRRTMRIREGDPLEIYTDREGEVIFKKYSPIGELMAFAAQYADTLNKTSGMSVVISDRDVIIACSGVSKKEYTEKKLSSEIEDIIESRALYVNSGEERAPACHRGWQQPLCQLRHANHQRGRHRRMRRFGRFKRNAKQSGARP